MKHNSVVRRTLCITGSAVMLAGLLSGYTFKDASVPAAPAYSVSRPSSDNITAGATCVVTASSLNIRSGPGEYYANRGRLTNGYSVKILEVDGRWGRMEDGWICLDYVRMTSQGSGSGTTTNDPSKIQAGQTGTVTATSLNIRSGPGTNYSSRGSLTKGYKVKILEVKDGWGRTNDGWVSLKYISGSGSSSSFSSGSTVQVTADWLNVRQGAGTGYAKVKHLTRGDKVTLLEVNGNWGRYSDGWISLNYVKYVSSGSTTTNNSKISEGDTVKVTADALRIRKGAGTNYPEIGVLYEGRTVKILEIINGWGRIENGGWISLNYVKNANASW